MPLHLFCTYLQVLHTSNATYYTDNINNNNYIYFKKRATTVCALDRIAPFTETLCMVLCNCVNCRA